MNEPCVGAPLVSQSINRPPEGEYFCVNAFNFRSPGKPQRCPYMRHMGRYLTLLEPPNTPDTAIEESNQKCVGTDAARSKQTHTLHGTADTGRVQVRHVRWNRAHPHVRDRKRVPSNGYAVVPFHSPNVYMQFPYIRKKRTRSV